MGRLTHLSELPEREQEGHVHLQRWDGGEVVDLRPVHLCANFDGYSCFVSDKVGDC